MVKIPLSIVFGAEFPPVLPAEPGVLPTWALVVIAVGAAIIAGLVFWFIKKRD